MVDFQLTSNSEAWLQEASLFVNEHVDYTINFDDLLSIEKANFEGSVEIQNQQDSEWLDRNVDLALLDNPNSLPSHPNETEKLMNDEYEALLLGLLSNDFAPSCLPSDAFKDEPVEFSGCLVSQNYITESTSSESLNSLHESSQDSSPQVSSPEYLQSQSLASPYFDILDVPEELSNYVLPSLEEAPVSVLASNSCSDSSAVSVEVCDDICSPVNASEEVLSIDEVARSMEKRKYVSDKVGIAKVKVIIRDFPTSPQLIIHGYPEIQPKHSKCPEPKRKKLKDERKKTERKKVQNKEAAARYRNKKRLEEKILSDEIEQLESKQKNLKEKHNSLKNEIKYLKKLALEILQKKGKL